jgi:YVTN family beta-propeller protein
MFPFSKALTSTLTQFRSRSVYTGCRNSRFFAWLGLSLTLILLLILCACFGASSGGSHGTPTQPPTTLSYAVATAAYTQLMPIAANSPTSTGGAVTSYSVTPPLPAGIALNTATGLISGMPTKPAATTIYTVTASNSVGSTTAPVTITVNIAAPAGLAYSSPTAYYTVGLPIAENVPTSMGGAPTTYGSALPTFAYSVSPSLPAGLNLSRFTPPYAPFPATIAAGVISGTPAGPPSTGSYVVTASNPAGTTTATLTITVSAVDASVAPPNWSYSAPAPVYTAGVAITQNGPSLPTSGITYTISPALSNGLSLDPSKGAITGTPAAIPSTIVPPPPVTIDYTVTAESLAGGSTTAPLTITVYNAPQSVPNMGQSITPLATAGSSFQFLDTGMVVTDPIDAQVAPVEWLAGYGASTSVSPDGKTLLVLTSGYNRVFQVAFPFFDPQYSSEYVFVYNIQGGAPVFEQALPIPNAYHGIVWDPSSTAFYVSGGMGDADFGTDPIPYVFPTKAAAINNGDNVHIITQQANGSWLSAGELDLGQSSLNPPSQFTIATGHPSGNGLPVPDSGFASVNAAVYVAPCAAGVAISNDGQTLVVANYYNDSVTVFTGGLNAWKAQYVAWPAPFPPPATDPPAPPTSTLQGAGGTQRGTELDLRPGNGLPGGEYPFWVVMKGNSGPGATAYVSSLRDREIDVVNLEETCAADTAPPSCTVATLKPVVTARIPVKGQPNKMTLNAARTLLYVAEDESDTVDVINLATNSVVETIPVIAPPSVLQSFSLMQYTGANTNSVTLSEPDEKYLYVTNGNLNNIAVVPLGGTNSGDQVAGLIPTGWYPNSVSLSSVSGSTWAYVVTAKSPTGANPNWCYAYGPTGYPTCNPANQYNPQLTKAGLQSFPVSSAMGQLSTLTNDVTTNNRFSNTSPANSVMATVHAGIQHVIYILKENRTYDQILGDLGRGNGDPALALFGQVITPNQHNLASQFVTLDNFRATAEVSYDGWPWSTSARVPDVIQHQYPVNYAQRGLSLDSEGMNRSVNVALPTVAQRQASDPLFPGGALSPDIPNGENLLPGQADVGAPDGPGDEINTGYLWDNALRAGLTVRDYGFFIDMTCYNVASCQTPLVHDPFSTNTIVATSTNVALTPFTDVYFRGFDPAFPDYYRYTEWERDFDTNYATSGLPNLTLIRFMHDHTGNFSTASDLVNTPDRDVADNDYAVGLLVEKIAGSVYKNNTLIFIVEDDAQDGGDHVDSHRTTAYVAGAYVKNALVSTAYNTLDFVRTMEEVLGLAPMNLNDALANPMTDIFNPTPSRWSFTATPPSILYCTNLPLPQPAQPCRNPTPDAKYWAQVTKGMDFTDADRVDGGVFNRILWKGLMGGQPYPAAPTGKDLRQNREKLLADYRRSLARGVVTGVAARSGPGVTER